MSGTVSSEVQRRAFRQGLAGTPEPSGSPVVLPIEGCVVTCVGYGVLAGIYLGVVVTTQNRIVDSLVKKAVTAVSSTGSV